MFFLKILLFLGVKHIKKRGIKTIQGSYLGFFKTKKKVAYSLLGVKHVKKRGIKTIQGIGFFKTKKKMAYSLLGVKHVKKRGIKK